MTGAFETMSATRLSGEVPVERVETYAYEIPTDGPDGVESDGTLTWDSTTLILVVVHGGGRSGLGYTYGDASTAAFIRGKLAPALIGGDARNPPALALRLFGQIRNAGQPGVGAMALSAADVALWDLKARLLDAPLISVLPSFHTEVPVYGSGGFTNYPLPRLAEQLGGWVQTGIPRVKLKISREPEQDPRRLDVVREAIGDGPELFVDSNGALTRKQALYWAHRLAEQWDVRWFEEPVSSGDLPGLHLLREAGPGRLEIAAGEYGYLLRDFTALIEAQAVDCLQADVTRCGGITGVLQVAALAAGHGLDLSGHCAPAVSAHALCAAPKLRHLEHFHDHVRIEEMVFDGRPSLMAGALRPDPDRPGLGLEVRWADIEKHQTFAASTS